MTEPCWSRTVDLEGRPAPQAVSWAEATSDAERSRLGRWRRAVGPAWFGQAQAASGASADAGRGRPLVVASWNARTGGGALLAFWKRLLDEADGGPVVALLQEVFSAGAHLPEAGSRRDGQECDWAERIAEHPPQGEPRTDIVSFARQAGLSLLYVPSMRNGAPAGSGRHRASAEVAEDRGNAVLANVPLCVPAAVELPFERQRRVAVAARLRFGRERIGVCSVHLDNRAPWRRAWRSLGTTRRRQMAALLPSLSCYGPAQPFALGGDFNTWVRGAREAAYRLARERFPHPETPDPRPTHHFEIGGRLRRSDHLLFALPEGWLAECRRLDDAFGSDHYPLLGTLRIPAAVPDGSASAGRWRSRTRGSG